MRVARCQPQGLLALVGSWENSTVRVRCCPTRPAQRTGKNGQSDNLSLRGGKQLGEPFPVRKESLKYVLAGDEPQETASRGLGTGLPFRA
jgi:hypothetical protein